MGEPKHKMTNELAVDESGKADTLHYNVVTYVVEEKYDKAVEEMEKFLNLPSPYPGFQKAIARYISHGIDLINAIRAKRKFPGVHSLTMAKQQELNDRYHEHFNELQHVLKRIDKVQQDLKLQDVRSTVLVVRAVVNAAFLIAVAAFLIEAFKGLGNTAWYVVTDGLARWTSSLLTFFGL
jgi:hypothetical protein